MTRAKSLRFRGKPPPCPWPRMHTRAADEREALDAALAAYGAPCRVPAMADLFTSETPAELDLAARLCAGCPVLAECAAYARALRPTGGVWAGRRWTINAREAV